MVLNLFGTKKSHANNTLYTYACMEEKPKMANKKQANFLKFLILICYCCHFIIISLKIGSPRKFPLAIITIFTVCPSEQYKPVL